MTEDIDWHSGPRGELRPLFELAEDSRSQLDHYLELGRVLVAREGSAALSSARRSSGARRKAGT